MCLLDLFQGTEEAIEIAHTFGGTIFGGSNAEKSGDHEKKKFFINKSRWSPDSV